VIRLQNISHQAALWLSAVVIAVLLPGCGEKEKPRDYGKIKGTVTYKGKPLDHGNVIFQHVEGPTTEARINPDGTYETNAVVGDTLVGINCREPDIHGGGVRQEIVPGKSIVPPKLGSPQTSGLKYKIIPGEDTWDIKL